MKQIKVVVTGGPSGGKTTLLEALKKELGPRVALVPEAATILYRGGFPRSKDKIAAMHTQRSIYFVQRELEFLYALEGRPSRLVVCDRGSLDGIAYWPRSEADFFKSLASTRRRELGRYDWVLHLDTAAKHFYDDSNPVRTESFREALALNERIKKAWRGHPRRLVISQSDDFLSKMTMALAVIRSILEGRTQEEIRRELALGEDAG